MLKDHGKQTKKVENIQINVTHYNESFEMKEFKYNIHKL